MITALVLLNIERQQIKLISQQLLANAQDDSVVPALLKLQPGSHHKVHVFF